MHRVLHRPNLIMGGERELVLFALLCAAALAVCAMNIPSFICAAVIWFGVLAVLRMMGKADPAMSKVYMRHIKYRVFYAARSRPFAGNTTSAVQQWAILGSGLGLIVLILAVIF